MVSYANIEKYKKNHKEEKVKVKLTTLGGRRIIYTKKKKNSLRLSFPSYCISTHKKIFFPFDQCTF